MAAPLAGEAMLSGAPLWPEPVGEPPVTLPAAERRISEAADLPLPMPLPNNPQTVFLGGLLLLASLAALYVAREIALPIILAFILKLLLQPAMRMLERMRVPRTLAAVLLIIALFGAVGGFAVMLSGPAANWASKLPAGVPRLQERLSMLSEPIAGLRRFLHYAEGLTAGDGTPAVVEGASLSAILFSSTREFLNGLFTTILLLFFLLVSGDTFLRRLVEVLPRFRDKRQAVEMSQQIESDISAYLTTITIMNAAVGIATFLVMWVVGISDPMLWGAVAFLLNYIPVLGPMLGIATFLMVGLITADSLLSALLPGGLYLVIHMIEGQTVTPMLLARRFTLNPVLIIISLVFWYWMWGVPGAILAVPMLAIIKIICGRIRSFAALAHFLEG
jgi:predicted PurR-regulated permease PerM